MGSAEAVYPSSSGKNGPCVNDLLFFVWRFFLSRLLTIRDKSTHFTGLFQLILYSKAAKEAGATKADSKVLCVRLESREKNQNDVSRIGLILSHLKQ